MEVAPFFVDFHHFFVDFHHFFYQFSWFTHFCRDLHFVAIYTLFPQIFFGQNSILRNITRFLHVWIETCKSPNAKNRVSQKKFPRELLIARTGARNKWSYRWDRPLICWPYFSFKLDQHIKFNAIRTGCYKLTWLLVILSVGNFFWDPLYRYD